jgi:hypothetical protein
VIPWPKIELRTIPTTEAKDTLIPEKEISSVKTEIRIWAVTWELMLRDNGKEGAL